MLNVLTHYLLFLAEAITLVAAILILVAGIIGIATRNKAQPGSLSIRKMNERLLEVKKTLNEECLDKKAFKKFLKATKTKEKSDEKSKRVFVIQFDGDINASQAQELREVVTAVLQVARKEDEVVVKVESGGGVVHGYGFAASQLARLKERQIPLTVCVDKIAASGGYLMASVADQIIAAPFAIIGSIGVIAQLPNFHRLLKKHDIDFEQVTAGKYKRSLTLFGKNTDEGREKMQEDLEEVHQAFKAMIHQYRPSVDLDEVANGDYWLASDAQKLHLVDRLMTSDDYLLYASEHANIFELRYEMKKTLLQKLQGASAQLFSGVIL